MRLFSLGLWQPGARVNERPSYFVMALVGLFPLFLTIVGLLGIWHTTPKLLHGLQARHWPEATGTVTDAVIEEVDSGPSTPGSKRWFEVRLQYWYEVGGKRFESSRVAVWNERYLSPTAKSRAAEYLASPRQTVYYDPANPSDSLLDRDIGVGTWTMEAGSILGLALSVVLWIGLYRACLLK